MTAQNQRDPDGTDILGQVRDGLAELKANVISRWGRVPHVAADPASPPDGAVWIRSDTRRFRFRANGSTVSVGQVASFSAAGGGGVTAGAVELGAVALVVPDQGCAGTLKVWAHVYCVKTVNTDVFYSFLRNAAGLVVLSKSQSDTGNAIIVEFDYVGEVAMTAGTGVTVNLSVVRAAGTGTATFTADATLNRIDGLFIPT